MTVAVILALALVNVRGVRWGGLLQLIITSVKISTLVGVILLPFIVLGFTSKPEYPPQIANISPAWPADWGGVDWSKFGKALVGVIWAYHGWMNIGPIAEEVKNPQRNIPLALIGGVGAIIFLYCGANFAYYLVIPRADMILLHDTPVATEFSQRLLGPIGGIVTSIAIAISVFGALNGNILVGPRLLYAMGEDRLAPHWLSRLHPKFQTPLAATLIMAGWSCGLVLLVALWLRHPIPVVDLFGKQFNPNPPAGKSGFDVITDYAMFGAIALETLAVASIFALRISRRDAAREYRCPDIRLCPPSMCWPWPPSGATSSRWTPPNRWWGARSWCWGREFTWRYRVDPGDGGSQLPPIPADETTDELQRMKKVLLIRGNLSVGILSPICSAFV